MKFIGSKAIHLCLRFLLLTGLLLAALPVIPASAATYYLEITNGDAQSTPVGAAFYSPLQVRVTRTSVLGIIGANNQTVTYTVNPVGGAGATLSSNTAITETSSLRAGFASVTATANGTAGAYTVTASNNGNVVTFNLTNIIDNQPPSVNTITRNYANPSERPTVQFDVTFSEHVTGVDNNDFSLVLADGQADAAFSGSPDCSGNPTICTISVTTGSGNGMLGLDLVDSPSIQDDAGNPLSGPFTGEVYKIIKEPPVVSSISVTDANPTNADTVHFTVTFSDDVTGVDISDFELALSSGVSANIDSVNGLTDSTYTVTVNNISGNGTLGLNLVDDDSIHDFANPINHRLGGFRSENGDFTGESYTIDSTFPIVIFGARTIPADGSVLLSGPTQITVEFSKDVLHNGSEEAADNSLNYLLIGPGADGEFSSEGCGYLSSLDEQIPTGPVTYDNTQGFFLATVTVNNGSPLPNGVYQLFICGSTSIVDLAGNHLNDGNDTHLEFTVTAPPAPADPQPTTTTATLVIPLTGFTPNRVTALPPQTVSYADLGDLWLEIPALGVQMPIVGVPQTDGVFDVSWLGNDVGWLNGSAFPTWAGNSVLTGHVYDAYGKPGPFVGLNRLWYGSQVIVHAWGGQYVYEVRSVTQVAPNDTTAMMKHQELPWLTLVTCRGYDEASNSYKYRVLVRAVLVDVK